jgi:hypothetical protein
VSGKRVAVSAVRSRDLEKPRARLMKALAKGLREGGLPHHVASCEVRADGSCWALLEVSVEANAAAAADKTPEEVAEAWVSLLAVNGNKALAEAKKTLKERESQVAFLSKAAEGNAHHAQAMQEVLATAKTLAHRAQTEYWPAEPKAHSTALYELLAMLEEWSPS